MVNTIKVATWNVREGTSPDEPPSVPGHGVREEMVDLLIENSVDVVALQEVDFTLEGHSVMLEAIASSTPLRHTAGYAVSPSSFFADARSGVAVASRSPIAGTTKAMVPNPDLVKDDNGRDFRSYDKGFIRTEIDVTDRRMSVFSLHAVPFRRFGMSGAEADFEHIWDSFAEGVNTLGDGEIVVCGDFNTVDRGVLTTRLKCDFSSSMDGQPTHDNLPLDDILCSTGFRLRDTTLLPNFSDHLLCIAELELGQVEPR